VHRQESGRLWGSFCLVWRSSLQQFPGPSHLLISISTEHWLLLNLTMIKPRFLILFSLLCGPWENTVLFKCRHPLTIAQSSYVMSLIRTWDCRATASSPKTLLLGCYMTSTPCLCVIHSAVSRNLQRSLQCAVRFTHAATSKQI
jgi:hypothetical protein